MKKNKKTIGRGDRFALIALFCLYATAGAVEACDNQAASNSIGSCSTANQCSNFNSGDTCTTAVTVAWFPTGCVASQGSNCDKPSEVCTTPVACQWVNDQCSPGAAIHGGTTGNAACPTTVGC